MADRPTATPRFAADARELDRSRRAFLRARAQLATGDADRMRLEAARRKWIVHRRRFS
jgi:hypothetical protein